MKETIFVDMDGVLADYKSAAFELLKTTSLSIDEISNLRGFYWCLNPIPGSIEAFKLLSNKFNAFILSSPSWESPSSYMEKRLWVEIHLGELAFKKLILAHEKSIFSGKLLIDDRKTNGAENFKGKLIHFGSIDFPNWKSILEYLEI